MQAEVLIQWMREPGQMNRESMIQLKALLDEYPCFSIARILYLKSLLHLNDLHFSTALLQTAISVPDRRRLYYFLEGQMLKEEVIPTEETLSGEDGFSIIERFLHEATQESKGLDLTESVDDELTSEEVAGEEAVDETEFSAEEMAAVALEAERMLYEEPFTLDYIDYLSRQSDVPAPETPADPMHGQEWIDEFLTKSNEDKSPAPIMPKLEPASAVEAEFGELENLESDLSEDSFTVTLAKIYLKQKRYDRALEIFKSLSLKYPEKNVYFADQIRFLEKLIINIKNQ
jgi:hypothetical protein